MISVDYEQVVYAGNGSQDAWPYSFPIDDGDVIRLILIDTDGTEINIEQDYFVDVPGSTVYYPGYAPGEEPPVADQPPKVQSGQKLIVYRDTEITQDSNLGDSWPFNVIEKGLDKLTMILQEKAFALARCLKISQGQAAEIDNYDPTVPLEAGKVICGNAAGDGFEAREALMEVNGAWDGEGRQIHSVADPTGDQDAATKNYVDDNINYVDNSFMKLQEGGEAWEGRGLPISNVAGPALVKDAANKDYVDRILAGYSGQGDRFVFFDNVAQMQAAELVPSQMAVTLGYYDVNDGGAGVYTIRDIGADTPDGGSIIEIPGTSYVAELIVSDEVNINQFGGVGDGTTDDNVAIVNAVTYASAKNKRLVFLEGKTYYTSVGIVIANPPDEIRMDGALLYTGNGTALTIGDAGESQIDKIIKLYVLGTETVPTGSCGVKLYNFNNSQIFIYDVRYFNDAGVEYCGNTKGFAYNSTYVGVLYSCGVLLRLTSITPGWCNENKFFGGRFGTRTGFSLVDTMIGVVITSDGNSRPNNNIFYSPSLELKHGVKIEYGNGNMFYDCRTEGSDVPFDVDLSNLSNVCNYMFASYGMSAFRTSSAAIDNGSNQYIDMDTFIRRSFTETIFDSGNIAENVASNASYCSCAKVFFCGKGNVGETVSQSHVDISNGELSLVSDVTIGTCVDTINNKTFMIDACTSKDCVITCFMWDSNGNLISDKYPFYSSVVIGRASAYFTYGSGASQGSRQYGYYVGPTLPMIVITVPSTCVKAFFGVSRTPSTGDVTVYNLKIKARYNERYYTLSNRESAVLDTIPTSVGKVGQFVKKTVPTLGEIGWVYDGTNWLSVG